jgi:HEAT repeat protein
VTDDTAADALREGPSVERLDAYYATHSSDECAELARELLHSSDKDARAIGLRLLGRAAAHEQHLHGALDEAVVAAARDGAVSVRVAAAVVAGEVPTTRSIDVLVALVWDASLEVRSTVASSLPLTTDPQAPNPRVVGALQLLTADDDALVRDFAAFSLGTQLPGADNPAVRAALHRLLDDPDTDDAYPAAEAAVGLALRGDASVAPVIVERLRRGGAGQLWLDAAAALALPELLPTLCSLREPGDDATDPWVVALDKAIAACEPGTGAAGSADPGAADPGAA